MDKGKYLDSWKEIAAYLGRNIRTCRNWERELGLPVHRLEGAAKSHVFAYTGEIDAWREQKSRLPENGTRPTAGPNAISPPSPSAALPTARPVRRLSIVGPAAILLLAVLVALLIWHPFAPPGAGIRSIAVVPLEDLSVGEGQGLIADGISEGLTAEIGQISALRVLSWRTMQRYKKTTLTVPEIGSERNVDALLTGSVRRLGARVRVHVALVRVSPERVLWSSEPYDRELGDSLSLQAEIARAVAREVRAALTPGERTRLAGARPVDTEAYEAYLRGKRYMNDGLAEFDLRKSRDELLAAVRIDPKFALAFAGLADGYAKMSLWGLMTPLDAAPLGVEAAARAVTLDPDLAEAHAALGSVKSQLMWKWAEAETSLKKALELNPSSYDARFDYRFFLTCVGRMDEAVALEDELLRERPDAPDELGQAGWTYFYARRFDEAIAFEKRVLEIRPESGDDRIFLAAAYAFKGMRSEALAECDILEEHPEWMSEFFLSFLGAIRAVCGEREKALQALGRVRERERTGYVDPAEYAYVYAGLGDKEQAFAWLEKAIAIRSTNVLQMNNEPVFDGLRSDPRFGALLAKLGLPR